MNKRSITFVLAGALMLSGLGAQTSIQDSRALANVKLYKTDIITVGSFKAKLERLNKQVKAAETLESLGLVQGNDKITQTPLALLESEIDKILVRQAAEKEKLAVTDAEIMQMISLQKKQLGAAVTDEAFNDYIEQQLGVKFDEFKQIVQDSLLQNKLIAKMRPDLKNKEYPVSEDEILDVYDQKASEFVIPRVVRYQFLIGDTTKLNGEEKKNLRQKFVDMAKTIKSGGKNAFDKLLEKAADDTSYEGGDIGTYVSKNDPRIRRYFGPGFTDAIFKLNVGEFSDVIDTPAGYVIAYITYKKGVTLPGLDDAARPGDNRKVRDAIRDAISNQKSVIDIRKASAEILKKLREQATILKFENNYPWK